MTTDEGQATLSEGGSSCRASGLLEPLNRRRNPPRIKDNRDIGSLTGTSGHLGVCVSYSILLGHDPRRIEYETGPEVGPSPGPVQENRSRKASWHSIILGGDNFSAGAAPRAQTMGFAVLFLRNRTEPSHMTMFASPG